MGCRRALALVALTVVGGCVVLPPSRTELSGFAHAGATGYRVATGGHAASAPKNADMRIDLGAGYVYEQPGDDEDDPGQHGSYIELARQVWRRGSTRVHAGGRVDVFWNDVGERGTRRGVSTRLSIERVAGHVAGGSGNGNGGAAAYGLVAPGLFIEAGVRERASGDLTGAILVGMHLRLPLIFAASKPTAF